MKGQEERWRFLKETLQDLKTRRSCRKFKPEQIEHAMQLLAAGNSYTQVEQMTGISKSTLVRETRSRKAEALED